MRALYFEDEKRHCECGHQERDHDKQACLHERCGCLEFEHSAEADERAADDAWRRSAA
jgi:hypothetical protein